MSGLGEARSITLGRAHLCAIGQDGVVRCMGANNAGQLGADRSDPDLSPMPVAF